jgi:hypothetical protein
MAEQQGNTVIGNRYTAVDIVQLYSYTYIHI